MAHPDYINIGSPEIKTIEECSELIKALCKSIRFGWNSTHPDTPEKDNLQLVEEEIQDVERAIKTLREHMKVVGAREALEKWARKQE